MKTLFRILASVVVILAASGLTFLGIEHAWHREWAWLVLSLFGLALFITGVQLARGDRVRDVIKDLVSNLMWWSN